MDSVSRVVRLCAWFVVGLVLGGALVSTAAYAQVTEYPAAQRFRVPNISGRNCGDRPWFQSRAEVCSWAFEGCGYSDTYSEMRQRPDMPSQCQGLNEYGNWSGLFTIQTGYYCPHGGTLNTSTNMCTNLPPCEDPDAIRQPDGQCYVPTRCEQKAGQSAGQHEFFRGWATFPGSGKAASPVPVPASVSIDGCQAVIDQANAGDGGCYTYQTNESKIFCSVPYKFTGADAGPGDGPPDNGAPPTACPAGTTYGTVNGSFGCYASGDPTDPGNTDPMPTKPGVPPAPSDSGGAPGDGGGGAPGDGGSGDGGGGGGGGAGSEDGAGTGSGPGGGGRPGGSGTGGDGEQGSFCSENPDSQICKTSSISVPACQARAAVTTTCDGDAIQCEIAKQQAMLACELKTPADDPMVQLADQIIAGNDPMKSQFPTESANVETKDLPTQLDQGGFLANGSLNDVSFNFKGQQFTLPFSEYQWVLELLGNLLVGISLIIGARIVFG